MTNIVTGGSGVPSDALKKVADGFKGDAEKSLGHKFQEFNPVYYRFNVVSAGVRYLFFVQTSANEHFKSYIGLELLQNYHGEDASHHGKYIFIDAVPLYTVPVTQPGGPNIPPFQPGGPNIPATPQNWNPLWGIGPQIPSSSQETQQPAQQQLGAAQSSSLLGPYSQWKPTDKSINDLAQQVKSAAEEYLGTTFQEYTPKEYRSRLTFGIRFGQIEIVVQTGWTAYVIHDAKQPIYTQLNVSTSNYGGLRGTLNSAESIGVSLPHNPIITGPTKQ